jgi:hypothetical protein
MSAPDDSFITSFRAYRTLEAFTRQLNHLHLTPSAAKGSIDLPPTVHCITVAVNSTTRGAGVSTLGSSHSKAPQPPYINS